MTWTQAALWVWLVLVHGALLLFLVRSDSVAQRVAAWGLRRPPPNRSVAQLHEIHRQQDATVPPGAVIFLGDSHFQRLATASVAPGSVNFGVGGIRTEDLIEMMRDFRSLHRASLVFISIGTNDVFARKFEGLQERYQAILNLVPPGVPVVLSSVFPLPGRDVRPAVDAARAACSDRLGCVFVDAHAVITESMLDDGIHLNAAGYQVWARLLREAATTPRIASSSLIRTSDQGISSVSILG